MFSWVTLCATRPAVMGVVNVTPDSFSDGGAFIEPDAAVAHGLALVAQGADLLDVGGESTRPGAVSVSEAEELRRVLPVVSRLAREAGVPLSIDTSKAAVAAAALDAGAAVVNDVSAGRADPDILEVAARAGAGYVAMHMQGDPRTMQDGPRYHDVVAEVADFLCERLEVARRAGIADDALCADPGIGFGKLARHNLELLAHVRQLRDRVGAPVMVGVSRKSFLRTVVGGSGAAVAALPPAALDDATLAASLWAVDQGAWVVRVHDVRPIAEALRLLRVMQTLDEAAA